MNRLKPRLRERQTFTSWVEKKHDDSLYCPTNKRWMMPAGVVERWARLMKTGKRTTNNYRGIFFFKTNMHVLSTTVSVLEPKILQNSKNRMVLKRFRTSDSNSFQSKIRAIHSTHGLVIFLLNAWRIEIGKWMLWTNLISFLFLWNGSQNSFTYAFSCISSIKNTDNELKQEHERDWKSEVIV